MDLFVCKKRYTLQKIAIKELCRILNVNTASDFYVTLSPDCVGLFFKQCKKYFKLYDCSKLFSGKHGFLLRDLQLRYVGNDTSESSSSEFYNGLLNLLNSELQSIDLDFGAFFSDVNSSNDVSPLPVLWKTFNMLQVLNIKWTASSNAHEIKLLENLGHVFQNTSLLRVFLHVSGNGDIEESIFSEENVYYYSLCNGLLCESLSKCTSNLICLSLINHGLHGCNILSSVSRISSLKILELHGCMNYVSQDFSANSLVLLLQQLPNLKKLDISVDFYLRGTLETASIPALTACVTELLQHIKENDTTLETLNITGYNNVSHDLIKGMQSLRTGIKCIIAGSMDLELSERDLAINRPVQIIDFGSYTNMLKALKCMIHCEYFVQKYTQALHDNFAWDVSHVQFENIKIFNSIVKRYIENRRIIRYSLLGIYFVIQSWDRRGLEYGSVDETINLIIKVLSYHSTEVDIVQCCVAILSDQAVIDHGDFNKLKLMLMLSALVQEYSYEDFRDQQFNTLIVMSMLVNRLDRRDIFTLVSSGVVKDLMVYLTWTLYRDGELLRAIISVLWNMSDESESVSQQIIEYGGMDVYFKIHKLSYEHTLLGHILGLFSNIAEAQSLHETLLNDEFITTTMENVRRISMSCSFFACAIICNLSAYWHLHQDAVQHSLKRAMKDVKRTVDIWTYENDEVVVAYRSFVPMEKLLLLNHLPTVQYWVIWTIRHVTKMDLTKYVGFIKDSAIYDSCKEIMNIHEWEIVRKGAADIVSLANIGSLAVDS